MGGKWGHRRQRQDDRLHMGRRSDHPLCLACGKISYTSEGMAKAANGRARYRFRTYFCKGGRAWHVMNVDKR